MSRPFDVAILGSGFAGSLLGLLLRKRGLSVLVIDRQKHPRFAIGESSTPAADFILESLCDEYDLPQLRPLCRYGSWCRSQPHVSRGLKRGFSYFHHREGEPFSSGANHERELLVAASANDEVSDTHWYRAEVDAFIGRLFVEAGGELWEETSVESIEDGPSWGLACQRSGAASRVEARFLVDGTGGDAALVRTLGLASEVASLSTHSRSLFGHFHAVREWSDLLHANGIDRSNHPYPCDQAALHHIIQGGWMWMLRFENGITSVGWSLDPRQHPVPVHLSPAEEWQSLLARYPSIADQLRDARPALPFTAEQPLARTGRLQRRVSQAAGANWALLPHTAGFIDPFYSTGIAQSLLGVESLAAILSGSGTPADRAAALEGYSLRLKQEITLIDQLVALAYQTMGRDPQLLHAASMLYFAAATTYEARRQHGKTGGAFLLADDEEFLRFVLGLRVTFPQNDSYIEPWVRAVQIVIEPWNRVGLFAPLHPNMYWHTAAK